MTTHLPSLIQQKGKGWSGLTDPVSPTYLLMKSEGWGKRGTRKGERCWEDKKVCFLGPEIPPLLSLSYKARPPAPQIAPFYTRLVVSPSGVGQAKREARGHPVNGQQRG